MDERRILFSLVLNASFRTADFSVCPRFCLYILYHNTIECVRSLDSRMGHFCSLLTLRSVCNLLTYIWFCCLCFPRGRPILSVTLAMNGSTAFVVGSCSRFYSSLILVYFSHFEYSLARKTCLSYYVQLFVKVAVPKNVAFWLEIAVYVRMKRQRQNHLQPHKESTYMTQKTIFAET